MDESVEDDGMIYLECDYNQRDEVKAHGFTWNSARKQWMKNRIDPWTGAPIVLDPRIKRKFTKVFLDVAFRDKDRVKELGARWDSSIRRWYAPGGIDKEPFITWIKDTEDRQSLWPEGYNSIPEVLAEQPSPVVASSSTATPAVGAPPSPQSVSSSVSVKDEEEDEDDDHDVKEAVTSSDEEMVLLEIPKRMVPKSFHPYIIDTKGKRKASASKPSNKRRR